MLESTLRRQLAALSFAPAGSMGGANAAGLPYMDAPGFARLSIHDSLKVRIAPVHPDFVCGCVPLSLMGFAG